ncbi:MAG: ECF transporter S component [Clostridia bacterium]|nr:ECF transporter S component [Clostridia bacterium]MBR0509419.1 ECF transporter S component [Clostridia bacterium]MBR0537545.1 ECF transporter S component [Clostridia bacterium]
MTRRVISTVLIAAAVPLIILLSLTVFREVRYAFVCTAVALLVVAAFFVSFERQEHNATKLMLIAMMTAFSVGGRVLFSVIPAFKPVTAVVILTALYFGPEAGCLTGALSALLSNFYFGQGPWTAFQMAAWGLIGFLAGLLAAPLKKHLSLLLVYAALSGGVYSLLMDTWTVIWENGAFSLSKYLTLISASATFTLLYMVSNVVFLLVLFKPVGRVLERLKVKYQII